MGPRRRRSSTTKDQDIVTLLGKNNQTPKKSKRSSTVSGATSPLTSECDANSVRSMRSSVAHGAQSGLITPESSTSRVDIDSFATPARKRQAPSTPFLSSGPKRMKTPILNLLSDEEDEEPVNGTNPDALSALIQPSTTEPSSPAVVLPSGQYDAGKNNPEIGQPCGTVSTDFQRDGQRRSVTVWRIQVLAANIFVAVWQSLFGRRRQGRHPLHWD
eukprot:GEMP01077351.1.p1 GENE.GEMP01077351.1~~GEMP01077351.1.p1  ORF type:complete len:216 (+),score=33.56 GEMP01077351.1:60-707(+)